MATAVAKALYGADLKIDHLQKAIDAGLLKASDLTDEPITATQVETLFAFLQDMQVVSVFATADHPSATTSPTPPATASSRSAP